jgi:ABC-2 type transport system ATP-binding protein
MMHEPDVLFLDEPTTGLDPQNRANLWNHIRALRERGPPSFSRLITWRRPTSHATVS